MPVVEVGQLVKHYKGVQALRGVSISVERGEIYGLLGRNGAGKTTMVKILLGVVRATSGHASILGKPTGDVGVRKHVGYLPEDHRFPDYHTARSALDYYGTLNEMARADRKRRIEEVLEFTEMKDAANRKVRTYSKGMKQRLGLASAMLHQPEVYFLDEPTDGVDPIGRKQIREALMRLKTDGKTIFVNSHILSEVEMISNRVGILELGQLVKQGSVADLTKRTNLFILAVEGDPKPHLDELLRAAAAVRVIAGGLEVQLADGASIDPVIDILRSKKISIRGVTEKRQSLEDIFIETLTGGA